MEKQKLNIWNKVNNFLFYLMVILWMSMHFVLYWIYPIEIYK